MSGIVQNNILRSSGTIAVSAAGLNWVDTVITGSTATVEAGNGYWVNTTSNTCTITLPSSAESGDQIVIIDYARTWGTNKIIIDSNGLNYQGNDDTYTVEYTTDGQSLNIVYSDATKGWLPLEDDVAAFDHGAPPTQKAVIYAGKAGSTFSNITNLVNSSGVVGSDVTGVGTGRTNLGGASYGGDKGVFAYGQVPGGAGDYSSVKNLVNNSGVIAADVSGVGSARLGTTACAYGTDKAIFGFGNNASGNLSLTNLCSNSGVISADVTGVGTARLYISAVGYGGDKGMFAYGNTGSVSSLKNLVSNIGVVASNTAGVGTARDGVGAAKYGGDKAIFAYGSTGSAVSMSNLVNSSGVIASDVTGVGTARYQLAGVNYGNDKAIFAFGNTGSGEPNTRNLVSNVGVVAADASGAGTGRGGSAAAGYSQSA